MCVYVFVGVCHIFNNPPEVRLLRAATITNCMAAPVAAATTMTAAVAAAAAAITAAATAIHVDGRIYVCVCV